MLAKTVEKSGKDWDVRLPYVLFAYRSSPQESTRESPFFLLYGCDPTLPAETTITPPPTRTEICIDNYKAEVLHNMQEAWKLARKNIKKVQKRQKNYDRHARQPTYQVGDRVFVYVPSAKSGKAYKFALPYKGPYCVLDISDNVACLQLVDQPKSDTIHVAISLLRHCPTQCLPTKQAEDPQNIAEAVNQPNENEDGSPTTNHSTTAEMSTEMPWKNRLRQRQQRNLANVNFMTRTSLNKEGEM